MTHGVVIRTGQGRSFSYAGQPMHVLAEPHGDSDGFAAAEMTVPAGFAGPVPHVHYGFDEGIYVLSGLLVLTFGTGPPIEAPAGSFCLAPRGVRHTFRNPNDSPVRVLGLWSPGPAGLAFMADIGTAIPAAGAPDASQVAEIYQRHASELLP
jgi:mannose-6-phosphate isomerase-like protein (cupin superfamily)